MESCAPFDAAQGYAMALTSYIDCQAKLLGEGGYAALSASNSPVIIALGCQTAFKRDPRSASKRDPLFR